MAIPKWIINDVFTSFHGKDTGNNFIKSLICALENANINRYYLLFDTELRRGDTISSSLSEAVKTSSIAIIVLSSNFASSTCSLDEVVNILKCQHYRGQLVLPVFYHVDPWDIQEQRGSVFEPFLKLEEDPRKVEQWRSALQDAAGTVGWHINNSEVEAEVIQQLVEEVSSNLLKECRTSPYSMATPKWIVDDVFLSFRGKDTRNNFIKNLFCALENASIKTFIDSKLHRGDSISSSLTQAIQTSRIAIVVLSPNFASSRWCLEEVVQILEGKHSRGQLVLPVFYHLDPSDVQKERGSVFEPFLAELEEDFKYGPQKVEKWRSALQEVAGIGGRHLNSSLHCRVEAEVIQQIVEEVSSRLSESNFDVNP